MTDESTTVETSLNGGGACLDQAAGETKGKLEKNEPTSHVLLTIHFWVSRPSVTKILQKLT
jgi:hypothetical protein